MKPHLLFILLVVVIFSTFLSGCSEESLATNDTGNSDQDNEIPLVINEPVNVEWGEIAKRGVADNTRKQFLIFEHQQGLDNMYLDTSRSAPQVDFGEYQVVMLGIGEHGHEVSLSISSVEEFERYTLVHINSNRPGDHCVVPLYSVSAIATFYRIKTRKEIIISESLNLAHCEPQPHHLN